MATGKTQNCLDPSITGFPPLVVPIYPLHQDFPPDLFDLPRLPDVEIRLFPRTPFAGRQRVRTSHPHITSKIHEDQHESFDYHAGPIGKKV